MSTIGSARCHVICLHVCLFVCLFVFFFFFGLLLLFVCWMSFLFLTMMSVGMKRLRNNAHTMYNDRNWRARHCTAYNALQRRRESNKGPCVTFSFGLFLRLDFDQLKLHGPDCLWMKRWRRRRRRSITGTFNDWCVVSSFRATLQSSTITYYLRYISHQPSTINHQPSTINHQPSAINHQPSTITVNRQIAKSKEQRANTSEFVRLIKESEKWMPPLIRNMKVQKDHRALYRTERL